MEARQQATDILILTAIIDLTALVVAAIALAYISRARERFAAERAHAEERAHVLALEDANRQMKDFLNIASHEIRTPLTSLKLSLQLAIRQVQRGSATTGRTELSPLLERAWTSTGQLERLASDFVDVIHIDMNTLNLRLEALDLRTLVADCVAEQRLYHPERNIKQVMPGDGVIVIADADRIRQVLTNYLNNALKFSDEAYPVVVGLRVQESEALVSVRDQGPGIRQEDQLHIWDQFYQAPGSEHKSGSSVGFGLGLYICKGIIERHGGEVGVESAPGQGATFFFTLPLALVPAGSATSAPSN
jgi:signal transduction histidine kinase